ncbi:hypothetical protein Srut_57280 [Streptomyces rutgersensis]|nr:hypothetical protein Srut_57280 [Streptomyces rutgersensis]
MGWVTRSSVRPRQTIAAPATRPTARSPWARAEHHVVAERATADQAADDDDGEDQDDALVDGEQQRGAGQRQLDLADLLTLVAPSERADSSAPASTPRRPCVVMRTTAGSA